MSDRFNKQMKFTIKPIFFIAVLLFSFTFENAQTISRVRKVETKSETKPIDLRFRDVVENRLKSFGYQDAVTGKFVSADIPLSKVCAIDTNLAARRVFYDYGAIFVAEDAVRFPTKCIFSNETEVQVYQNASNPVTENIGGTQITLQKPAMEALLKARKEARRSGLTITPRGGSISGKRSFEDTHRLWRSRFNPALNYWVRRKKISKPAAANARKMGIQDQVEQVLLWEDEGFYFSTGFNKSILYSVAAPGASQHIFMLALDVKQFNNRRVREILADNGWYQTVKSDLPHFTYLGRKESELPSLGLKAVNSGGYKFWIPNE